MLVSDFLPIQLDRYHLECSLQARHGDSFQVPCTKPDTRTPFRFTDAIFWSITEENVSPLPHTVFFYHFAVLTLSGIPISQTLDSSNQTSFPLDLLHSSLTPDISSSRLQISDFLLFCIIYICLDNPGIIITIH